MCPRCQGLLIHDEILTSDEYRRIAILKCIACAYCTDPLTDHWRHEQAQGRLPEALPNHRMQKQQVGAQ